MPCTPPPPPASLAASFRRVVPWSGGQTFAFVLRGQEVHLETGPVPRHPGLGTRVSACTGCRQGCAFLGVGARPRVPGGEGEGRRRGRGGGPGGCLLPSQGTGSVPRAHLLLFQDPSAPRVSALDSWEHGVLSGIPFPSGQLGLTGDRRAVTCHQEVLAHFSGGVLHQRHFSQLVTGRPEGVRSCPRV